MRVLASLLEKFYREYYHGHDDQPIFVGGMHFQMGHLLTLLASVVDSLVRSDCDFSFLNLADFRIHLDFLVRVAVSEECNSMLSKGMVKFFVYFGYIYLILSYGWSLSSCSWIVPFYCSMSFLSGG